MDERLNIIKINAVLSEKDRQFNAAMAEVCNLKGEIAVRDARLAASLQANVDLQKKLDALHETVADKVIAKASSPEKKRGRRNG